MAKPQRVWTVNQVVAFNLKSLRLKRRWTQTSAADKLAKFLGKRWSVKTFSLVERSVERTRIKHFEAVELIALCATFRVPLTRLFEVPTGVRVRLAVSDKEMTENAFRTLLLEGASR